MGQPQGRQKAYQSRLIRLLERGCIPWRTPWRDGTLTKQHLNLVSGHRYGGTDVILLELGRVERQAPLPLWCTYLEARDAGLRPRRGSIGVHLGWTDPGSTGTGKPVCVFNVIDLVGAPLQNLLRRRRKTSTWNLAWDGLVEQVSLTARLRELIHSGDVPGEDGLPVGNGSEKPLEDYLLELTMILLADRLMTSPRQWGPFHLAEADWIDLLKTSPQTFFGCVAWAGRAVNQLAPQGRTQGDVLTEGRIWCGSPPLDSVN